MSFVSTNSNRYLAWVNHPGCRQSSNFWAIPHAAGGAAIEINAQIQPVSSESIYVRTFIYISQIFTWQPFETFVCHSPFPTPTHHLLQEAANMRTCLLLFLALALTTSVAGQNVSNIHVHACERATKNGDVLLVNYNGTFTNGTLFDSSSLFRNNYSYEGLLILKDRLQWH
jgi:hypothetical protein